MKTAKIACFTLCAGAMLTQSVLADTTLDQRWYLAPGINYIFADDDRHADDGLGIRLGLGKAVSPHWNVEGAATGNQFDMNKGGGRYDQVGISLDAFYLYNRAASLTPFGVVGVGILNTNEPNGKHSNAMASIGGGLIKRFNDDGAAMRVEARYRADADSNSMPNTGRFDDWMLGLGLMLPFGDVAKPAAAVPAPAPVVAAVAAPIAVAPADDDKDGVINTNDRCPNTPAGAKVNAQGCELDSDNDGVIDSKDNCPDTAAGVKVNAQGCELDSDKDGVADSKDNCPDTAAGAKVNAQGCELDSDKDGVVDSKDRCPGTAAGIKVDATGCELDSDKDGVVDSIDLCPDSKSGERVNARGCKLLDVVTLEGVTFPTSSAELHGDDHATLQDAAETMKKHPEIKVEIAGYTDNRGSATINTRLSQERAEAVRAYLISKGVAADRLSAKGYGPVNPVASNNTEAGRQANRRVEMRILN